MISPYRIIGPAAISFSGGRSSAMMLCEIMKAHEGVLPPDTFVLFANTGKEREETLRFVDRVSVHLGVKIHWLEYRPSAHQRDAWTEVNFDAAARNGEPFASIISVRGYTPNPVARICTQHLKIKPMEAFMRAHDFGTEYFNVVGMRYDEPGRVARGRSRDDVTMIFPLYDAKIANADVLAFWKGMPFDLELPTIEGKTVHGNCDLCYLKGFKSIVSLIRENPERADWWIEQETRSAKLFRIDRPNYQAMKKMALHPDLFDLPDDDAKPCECID